MGIYTDLAEILSAGAKVGNQITESAIDDEIFKAADNQTQAVAQATGTGTGGDELIPAKPAVPAEIDNTLNDISRGKTAADKGGINENNYWANMQSKVVQLRTRYPGHRDYIDEKVASVTGGTPANKIRENLFQQQAANSAALRSEAAATVKLIEDWTEKGAILPEEVAKASSMSRLDIMQTWGNKAAEKSRIETESARIQLMKNKMEFKEDIEYRTAVKRSNVAVHDVMTSFSTQLGTDIKGLNDSVEKLIKEGPNVKSEEIQQVRQAFSAAKFQVQKQVNAIVAEYPSITPSKMKEITEGVLSRFESIDQALTDKDFGVVGIHTRSLVDMTEADKWNWIENKKLTRDRVAAQSVLGNGVYGNMHYEVTDGSRSVAKGDPIIKEWTDPTIAGIFGGDLKVSGAMKDGIDRGMSPQKALRASVNIPLQTLMDPKEPVEASAKAATALFEVGPENIMGTVAAVSVGKDGSVIPASGLFFQEIANPTVLKKMLTVKDSRPDLWANYVEWAKQSGALVIQKTADNVSAENEYRVGPGRSTAPKEAFAIKYDPDKKQFISMSGVRNAYIDNLNASFRAMAPILEAEGIDFNEYIWTNIRNLPKTGPFVTKLNEAVGIAVQEAETTTTTP